MSDSENQGAGDDLIFLYGRVARERDELRDAFRETAALYNEKTDYAAALEATITTLKAQLTAAERNTELLKDVLPHVSLAILPGPLDARIVQFADALSAPASDTGSEEGA